MDFNEIFTVARNRPVLYVSKVSSKSIDSRYILYINSYLFVSSSINIRNNKIFLKK